MGLCAGAKPGPTKSAQHRPVDQSSNHHLANRRRASAAYLRRREDMPQRRAVMSCSLVVKNRASASGESAVVGVRPSCRQPELQVRIPYFALVHAVRGLLAPSPPMLRRSKCEVRGACAGSAWSSLTSAPQQSVPPDTVSVGNAAFRHFQLNLRERTATECRRTEQGSLGRPADAGRAECGPHLCARAQGRRRAPLLGSDLRAMRGCSGP